MAVNVDKTAALEILIDSYDNAKVVSDKVGNKISLILEGTHKTYKYILICGLLAKATNNDIDIFSLQAKDDTEGAYDARSLCHKVVVPFERKYFPGSLGGSNEPFINNPARNTRLSKENPVRRGYDKKILGYVLDVFNEIQNSKIAKVYLLHSISILKSIYDKLESKYFFERTNLSQHTNNQLILDYINKLILQSCEGEICPLIVATMESFSVPESYIVIPHKVNESGTSSNEIGDIDIYENEHNLVMSIEVKDKDFTKEDVEHAIRKFAIGKLEKSMFIYGKNAIYDKTEVFQMAARYGRLGYYCSVISILDYCKIKILEFSSYISINDFISRMLLFAKNINAKDETIDWIKDNFYQCTKTLI